MKTKILMTNRKYPYKNPMINYIQVAFDQLVKIFPKRKSTNTLSKTSKILFVKPDHLGDCVLMLETIKNIIKTYPNTEFLLSPQGIELFRSTVFHNKTYSIRHFMHNREQKFMKKIFFFIYDYFKLIMKLKKNKYDFIFLMRSEPGNLITLSYFLGSKKLVGSEAGGLSALLDIIVRKPKSSDHESDNQRKIIHSVFPSMSNDLSFSKIWKIDYNTNKNKITLIMPNSGDRSIEIPSSYWVNEISREAHHHIIIAGDQDNRKLFDNFSAVHPSVENLSKKLSIEKLIQLIHESEMVYCLDSFGAHFAALMGKKTKVFSKNLPTLKRWAAHGKNVEYIFHD